MELAFIDEARLANRRGAAVEEIDAASRGGQLKRAQRAGQACA